MKFDSFATNIGHTKHDRLIALDRHLTFAFYSVGGYNIKSLGCAVAAYEIPENKTAGSYVRELLNKYPNLIIGMMPKNTSPFYPCRDNYGTCDKQIMRIVPLFRDSMGLVGQREIQELIPHRCSKSIFDGIDKAKLIPSIPRGFILTDVSLMFAKCECGGDKINSTHSAWCPKFK